MSGPIPEVPPDGNHALPVRGLDLTDAQWAALARLADRLTALEKAGEGPLGAAAAEGLLKASGVLQGRDLEKLSRELLNALEALGDAGAWSGIADNAGYVKAGVSRAFDQELIKELAEGLAGLRSNLRTLQVLAARLQGLETLLQGPAGQALATALMDVSRAIPGVDGKKLVGDLLRALGALSQSGSLDWISQNLPYLSETLTHIGRTAPEALATLTPLVETVRKDVFLAHRLAQHARDAEEFLAGPAGAALTAALVESSRTFTELGLGGALRDVLEVVVAWRRAGVFPLLKGAGETWASAASLWGLAGADGELKEPLMAAKEKLRDAALGERLRSAAYAAQAVGPDEGGGGLKGLYGLLTDPAVQMTLRQGAAFIQAFLTPPSE